MILTELAHLPLSEVKEGIEQTPHDDFYDDWYCINTVPITCPDCKAKFTFWTAGPHWIIVWESNDDYTMLKKASELKKKELDPSIRKYHAIYGNAVSYDEAVRHGWIKPN